MLLIYLGYMWIKMLIRIDEHISKYFVQQKLNEACFTESTAACFLFLSYLMKISFLCLSNPLLFRAPS